MGYWEKVEEAARYLKEKLPFLPAIGVTLGSGLSSLGERLEGRVAIEYGKIPHFPVSGVPGHGGMLVVGRLKGIPVLLLCGRVHLYEGWNVHEVTLATRVVIACSVRTIVLTNAAGALNPLWSPGDIMLISDHLNLQGVNALCGPETLSFGERFVDMTDVYDRELRAKIKRWAARRGVRLREGVYAGLLGPSYETRAEVRMLRVLGADAVGMSTVQEAIASRQMGAKVVGLSVITNLAAGVSAGPLSHQEVKETADRVKMRLEEIVVGILGLVHGREE